MNIIKLFMKEKKSYMKFICLILLSTRKFISILHQVFSVNIKKTVLLHLMSIKSVLNFLLESSTFVSYSVSMDIFVLVLLKNVTSR